MHVCGDTLCMGRQCCYIPRCQAGSLAAGICNTLADACIALLHPCVKWLLQDGIFAALMQHCTLLPG